PADTCSGQPLRRKVMNLFPDGTTVCLNCGQQLGAGKTFDDANAVCVAECRDVFTNQSDTPPPGGLDAFCSDPANVQASVNFPLHSCCAGACTAGGNPDPAFADPRRDPEPVVWTSFGGGAAANGSSLTRTTPTNNGGVGLSAYDAGAASKQDIFTKS